MARPWPVLAAAVVAALGPACTGADDTSPATSTATQATTTVAASTADTTPVDRTGPTADEPARRVAANPGDDTAGLWIGTVTMDETMVELTWAGLDDESVDVVYRVHRIETVGNDPQQTPMTAENQVYAGRSTSFVDTAVEPETFYTYLLVAEVHGVETGRRWAGALTTTDTTPPTGIDGLVGERTGDGVLLTWDRSTDDVEFASYAVFLVEGDHLTYIGGGADEAETSFLDTEPPDGSATYAVQAVDFHNNRSDPVRLTVE